MSQHVSSHHSGSRGRTTGVRWRRSVAAVMAVAMTPALAACGLGGGSTTGGAAEDVIKARLVTDPSGFDPATAKANDDYYVSRLLFDTLVRKGEGNAIVPGLASSWKAESASHYVFDVRKGATCSDGTEITPSIVATSLTRAADPKTGTIVRLLTFGPGAATITGDDAAGTVDIKLAEPWADLPAGLTLPQAGVICPKGMADLEGLRAGTVKGAFSGPYTLASAKPAVSYELALRKDYKAWPDFGSELKGRPAKRIVLTPVTEQGTVASQLLSGALDIGGLVDDNSKRLVGKDGFSTRKVVSSVLYLLLNQRPGTATRSPEVRAAIAQALDAARFTQAITGGRGERLLSAASPTFPCVNTDESLLAKYDEAAAAKVLKGVKLRMVGTTALTAGNELVAEMLRKAGAKVELSNVDSVTWSTTTNGGNTWDLTLQGDVNQVGTLPGSLLRAMGPATEDGGRNRIAAQNTEGYAALQHAMTVTDEKARCSDFAVAQRTMLERHDIVPLATFPSTQVTRDGVSIKVFGDYADPATLRLTN